MGVKIREKKKGSGIWWVFVAHRGERCSRLAGSEEAAIEAQDFIESQLASGLFQFPIREARKPKEPPKPTVRQYFSIFDETHLKLQRESTRDNYLGSFDTHIFGVIGEHLINQVKLEDIERIIGKMRSLTRKDGSPRLSRGTIDRTMRELRAFFNHAVEHGIIEKSPVPRPKKLNPKFKAAPSRREEIDPLQEDEVSIFLDTVSKDRHSRKHVTLFLALIFAGLRIGEAIALEWIDIDLRKRELVIRRTYDRDYKKLRPPKNDRIRRVPISNELFDSLQEHRRAKVKEWMARKASVKQRLIARSLWNDIEHIPKPIFCDMNGGYLDADNILRRHFKRCLRIAGIRERAQHDLRYVLSLIMFLVFLPAFTSVFHLLP
jgi:integrase